MFLTRTDDIASKVRAGFLPGIVLYRRRRSLSPDFILIKTISAGLWHSCGVNEPWIVPAEEVRVLCIDLI